MEKEITLSLNLSDEERSLIDLHSFLNILNVLNSELFNLQLICEENNNLKGSSKLIRSIVDSLIDKEQSMEVANKIELFIKRIIDDVSIFININNLHSNSEANQSLMNINSIMEILKVRIREILARIGNSEEWTPHSIPQLRFNFISLFAAVEQNAKGKYRIIYNIADHEERDYLINLSFDSIYGDIIYMPIVFQDVMRDLILNARKYTAPGGEITAGIVQNQSYLKFTVEDNGMGIPESEIENCVGFGNRGSNVSKIITNGGGYGLTKAYLISKQFGGKLFIKSKINKGTRVRILIPKKRDF